MRRLLTLLVLVTVLLQSPAAEAAGQKHASRGSVQNSTPSVEVSSNETASPVVGRTAAGPPPECVWVRDGESFTTGPDSPRPNVTGHFQRQVCNQAPNDIDGLRFVEEADPTATPLEVAEYAKRELTLPIPAVNMDPEPNKLRIVNVPTFMWLDQAWLPVSETASIGGVSATVTATPTTVVWDMGDGEREFCRGAGTPSDRNVDLREQSTDCQHIYRRSSAGESGDAFTVRATVNYRVHWTSSGAVGGADLGSVTRSTTFTIQVGEIQAINTYPRSENS